MIDDLFAIAMFADSSDDFSFATTLWACHLCAGIHSREDLLPAHLDTRPIAGRALFDIPIRLSAGSTTVVTENLLLDHEIDMVARIDICEADFEFRDHSRTTADIVMSLSMTTSEETGKYVKRIGGVLATLMGL